MICKQLFTLPEPLGNLFGDTINFLPKDCLLIRGFVLGQPLKVALQRSGSTGGEADPAGKGHGFDPRT